MKKPWFTWLASRPLALNLLWMLPILAGCAPMRDSEAGRRAPTPPTHAWLPAIGPAPMRFQAPDPISHATLPPLAMEDPPAGPPLARTEPSAAATSHPASATPPGSPLPAPPSTGPAPAPTAPNAQPGSPPLLAGPEAPIVTPQMLVQFFKPVGSNNLGGVWSTPVFIPPNPPPTKSSTATYQSR